MSTQPAPRVSIILPTYNRERFLRRALDSIRSQTFTDWELIVVDDGSTDGTQALLTELLAEVGQPSAYVRQPNAGAYAARNTGLGRARGEYVAFFDSDDLWQPDYLSTCLGTVRENPDVDWVYCACRVTEDRSGRVLAPSTFYDGGRPRPFLALHVRQSGDLRILNDERVLGCLADSGLFCGLQNSVIRRAALEPFRTSYRNEGEDVLAAIRAVAAGRRFGYIDRALVYYTVHDDNSSGSAMVMSFERRLALSKAYALGYEEVARELGALRPGGAAIRRAAARAWFWQLGYAVQWQAGARADALASYRRGLALWPWDLRFWKTYAVGVIRHWLSV